MKRTIILTLLLCMAVTASAQFGRSGPERQPFGRGAYRRGEFGGGGSPLNLGMSFYFEHPKQITRDADTPPDISQVNDLSGNGHNLVQAVGVSQPHYTSDGIDFDATNDYLSVIGIADLPTWTMFCLYKTTDPSCGVFEFSNSTLNRQGFLITSTGAPGKIYVLYGDRKIRRSDDAGFNSGAWQFVLITYNGTSPVVYLNNVVKTLGGSIGGSYSGAASRIMVGNSNGASQTVGLDGLIKMAGIIPRIASEAERLE